jgi:3',5'-cyclic AMP phosphodiesterase CpdA
MFTLAHLSDLHMATQPRPLQLIGKRGLGFINWQRKRKHVHRPDVLDAIVHDLKTQPHDHVAVTGDLVNLSLPDEYRRARALLELIGAPTDVTVIPGNHDVYIPGVEQSPSQYWGDYMRGDDGLSRFPFVRRRGGAALIALSTGLPTAPLLATGCLGNRQLGRLADALDQSRGLFRIVLIHHPPISPARRFLRRLTDGSALRRVLAAKGAELLLHGHDHRRALVWLDGPEDKKIPAMGVPSASANARHGDEDVAGYHLFNIDGASGIWRCELIARQRGADGTISERERISLY